MMIITGFTKTQPLPFFIVSQEKHKITGEMTDFFDGHFFRQQNSQEFAL